MQYDNAWRHGAHPPSRDEQVGPQPRTSLYWRTFPKRCQLAIRVMVFPGDPENSPKHGPWNGRYRGGWNYVQSVWENLRAPFTYKLTRSRAILQLALYMYSRRKRRVWDTDIIAIKCGNEFNQRQIRLIGATASSKQVGSQLAEVRRGAAGKARLQEMSTKRKPVEGTQTQPSAPISPGLLRDGFHSYWRRHPFNESRFGSISAPCF